MTFSHPWVLLLLPLAALPLWFNRRQGCVYSSLEIVPEDRLSEIAELLLRYLSSAMIACMIVALSNPHGPASLMERAGKGAQVVLVIDRSASMDDPFAGAGTEGNIGETKSAAARRLITRFVHERKDDMVGIVTFSNSAMHAIPLTQSREAIYAAINAAGGAGLLQTNIGAGLTKGIGMYEKMQDSGSRAIILLSDGAGRISPNARQKISDWMVREHINLYWIVLRQPDGISIFNTGYAHLEDGEKPAEIELHQFFQTLKTKYTAYEAEDPKALKSAIEDINQRERNPIRYFEKVPGKDYASHFLIAAVLMLSLLLLIKLMGVRAWQAV
ncbi:mxaC protein [Methylophilaceae bacterium]|nr:mxaC protein [Methylophilaceae bacterium]